MWDLGGQERLRENWNGILLFHNKVYYKGTKGIIFVVDSTDKDRMHIAKKDLFHMLTENVFNIFIIGIKRC
jgi:ADP-ribosylation factor-like protein 1